MKNIMTYGDHLATVVYDEDIECFRGDILGLTGSADFYGYSVSDLKDNFAISLDVYLDECKKHNINPYKDNIYISQQDIEAACGVGVLMELQDYLSNK